MSMWWTMIQAIVGFLLVVLLLLGVVGWIRKPDSIYANRFIEKNPMENTRVIFVEDERDEENADGVRGHLEVVGVSGKRSGCYENIIKRLLDVLLSFMGLIVLSPLFIVLILTIVIDDPGPVFFTQKRVGKNKQYFKIHKFRSMKMSTPDNVPTHMFENADRYITRVGRFLRAHSLDELPQIWDIFIGNMSVVGPRPALWNQEVLIAERDKYNANDVKPGLTGLAQINGRDAIDVYDKAKLDGVYVNGLNFIMDAKCFFGSIHVFLSDASINDGINTEIMNEKEK